MQKVNKVKRFITMTAMAAMLSITEQCAGGYNGQIMEF